MKTLFLIVLFSTFIGAQTNYYVDTTATGANDGTSWTDAWQSFADINWASLGAGDTLFISGGSTSKTYTEELNIQASGNANADLVIRAGLDAGHNGEVIIKRGHTGTVRGIYIYGIDTKREYVTIQKLTITESTFGIVFKGNGTGERINVITLDSLTITQWGTEGSGNCTAINIDGGYDSSDSTEHIDSIFITNCDISLIDTINAQTDAIGIKFAQNIVIDHTSIYLDNRSYAVYSNKPGHNDNIQVIGDLSNVRVGVYNLTVTNSTLTNLGGIDSMLWVGKSVQCHLLMSEDNGGDYIFYNNILNAPFFFNYAGGIMDKEVHFNNAKMILIHNTITGWKTFNIIDAENGTNSGTSNYIYKNNIFYSDTLAHDAYQYGTPASGDYEGPPLSNALNFTNWNQVDGNLYSTNCYRGLSNPKVLWYAGGDRDSAYITSNGGESSGDLANRYLVDPKFVDYTRAGWPDGTLGTYDFHLQANSPAIDNGADLQTYVESLGLTWEDKDGVARDSSPDCGAYQYTGSAADTIPTFSFTAVTGAELNSRHIGTAIFSGADSTFHVWSAADSFKVGSLSSYDVTMVTAENGDTLFTPITASGSYSTAVTNTIIAGGNSEIFSVTTKANTDTKTKLFLKK